MARHRIYVLNHSGHAPVAEWDPTKLAEIKTAEETFGNLQERGFHLFDASEPQETKTELTEFDPKVKEVIGFGQLEGG